MRHANRHDRRRQRSRVLNPGEEWARMCRRIVGACLVEPRSRWLGGNGGRPDEIVRAIVRGGWDQAPDTWVVQRARGNLTRRRRRYHGWPG